MDPPANDNNVDNDDENSSRRMSCSSSSSSNTMVFNNTPTTRTRNTKEGRNNDDTKIDIGKDDDDDDIDDEQIILQQQQQQQQRRKGRARMNALFFNSQNDTTTTTATPPPPPPPSSNESTTGSKKRQHDTSERKCQRLPHTTPALPSAPVSAQAPCPQAETRTRKKAKQTPHSQTSTSTSSSSSRTSSSRSTLHRIRMALNTYRQAQTRAHHRIRTTLQQDLHTLEHRLDVHAQHQLHRLRHDVWGGVAGGGGEKTSDDAEATDDDDHEEDNEDDNDPEGNSEDNNNNNKRKRKHNNKELENLALLDYTTVHYREEDTDKPPYKDWKKRYMVLVHYVTMHEGKLPTNTYENKDGGDGFALGRWLQNQRNFYWNQGRTNKKARKQMTAPRKRALEQIPGWTWYHSSQHQHKMDKLRRRHQQQQQQQQQNEGSGTGTGGETRDDGNQYPMNSFDPTNVEQIAQVRQQRQQQEAKSIDPSTFVFTTEDMTQKRYQQWMDRFKVVYQYVRANNGVLPKVTYRNIETDGFDVGTWIRNQRTFYWNQGRNDLPGMTDGKESRQQMTVQRKNALESIPSWNWGNVYPDRRNCSRKTVRNDQNKDDNKDGNDKTLVNDDDEDEEDTDPSTFIFVDEPVDGKPFQLWLERYKMLIRYLSSMEDDDDGLDGLRRLRASRRPKIPTPYMYSTRATDGFNLGTWCYNQRSLYWRVGRAGATETKVRGIMTKQRILALESIPVWSWRSQRKTRQKKKKKNKTTDNSNNENDDDCREITDQAIGNKNDQPASNCNHQNNNTINESEEITISV